MLFPSRCQPPALHHVADLRPHVAAEMAGSKQRVAVKITCLHPGDKDYSSIAAAAAMDVAVGGCLAKCGGHVPFRILHRISRTTYCDTTDAFCKCAPRFF